VVCVLDELRQVLLTSAPRMRGSGPPALYAACISTTRGKGSVDSATSGTALAFVAAPIDGNSLGGGAAFEAAECGLSPKAQTISSTGVPW